jgi:DNA-binding transcriptional MocR family regulator
MNAWMPNLGASDKPRYLAIADAIGGRHSQGSPRRPDRLPPQRKLTHCLDVDFTTVARAMWKRTSAA